MRRATFLFLAGLLTSGCSSSEPSEPATPVPDERCSQEQIAACRVNQQGCALVDGASSCMTCGVGEYADEDDGACAAIGGEPISHTSPENTTPAGSEIVGTCRSWTLNNDTPLWINAVELQQDEASHHSNWMFVPDDEFDGPDGIWPCSERSYSQLSAALAGGRRLRAVHAGRARGAEVLGRRRLPDPGQRTDHQRHPHPQHDGLGRDGERDADDSCGP